MPSGEDPALSGLIETMRFRAPGRLLASNSAEVRQRLETQQRRMELAQTDELSEIASEIDKDLSACIPPHAAYNLQRLHAVRTIAESHLAPSDPLRDETAIEQTLADINGRKLIFAYGLKVDNVADLHHRLKQYQKLKAGDQFRFPKIEVLGYREDENRLLVDGTQATGKSTKRLDQKDDLLKEINAELDTFVPPGAHFNAIRQTVIDVVGSDPLITGWVECEDENEKQRAKEPAETFRSNKYHYVVQKPIDALNEQIGNAHATFQLVRLGRKPIPSETAARIAENIQTYRRMSFQLANSKETQSAIQRGQADRSTNTASKVPSGVELAIRREEPFSLPGRPETAQMAQSVVDIAHEIAPPELNDFYSRERFLRMVSGIREVWLEGDRSRDNSGRLERFHLRYPAISRNEIKIAKLAEALDAYHLTWDQPAQTRQPSKRKAIWLDDENELPSSAASGKSGARVEPPKKPVPKRRRTQLELAGMAKGQQKLNFGPKSKEPPTPQEKETGSAKTPEQPKASTSKIYLNRAHDRQRNSVER